MEDEILKNLVGMLLSILFIGSLLRHLRQPYFIAYILAGVALGPTGMGMFKDVEMIAQVGSLGLVMQMFFTGMEIEVPSLVRNMKTFTIGAAMQLLFSLVFTWLIGVRFGWNASQITLFGFIISVSSSAIVLEYLNKNSEVSTRLGTLTTGILIYQDFLIVPMIMILNFMASAETKVLDLIIAIMITVVFSVVMRAIALKRNIEIRLPKILTIDHELQLFLGLLICFGFAWLTSLMHLSAALGAMFAGMVISKTDSTHWLEKNLSPFKTFFLSLFFFSIGLQIDLNFLGKHISLILLLVVSILLVNSVINALVFRLLRETWKNSVYAGALLSQIGEFSLVLCTVAKTLELVDNFSFQLTLAVVSVSMLATAAWIGFIRKFLFQQPLTNNNSFDKSLS